MADEAREGTEQRRPSSAPEGAGNHLGLRFVTDLVSDSDQHIDTDTEIDIAEFVSDLGSTLHGYPYGDPYVTVACCVYDLEDDLTSDATVFWLLGVAASGPYMVWCDRRSDIARAKEALRTALASFRDREGTCAHDSHPWGGDAVQYPDDPLGFIDLIHEADEWQDDPEEEESYDTSFTELWRCPVNLATIARDALDFLESQAPGDGGRPGRLPG